MSLRVEQDEELARRVDGVLGGLGAVWPDGDFASRVGEALQARADASVASSDRGWRPAKLWPAKLWGPAKLWPAFEARGAPGHLAWSMAAVAGGVLWVAAGVYGYRGPSVAVDGSLPGSTGHRDARAKPFLLPSSPAGAAGGLARERPPVPTGVGELGRAGPLPVAGGVGGRRRDGATAGRVTARMDTVLRVAARSSVSADLDRVAAQDVHAPSFPAPPLPPTAQERQVRLMLRRGEKHDLAQLDPVRNALFAAEEQIALHDFFEPPKPKLDPTPGDAQ